VVVGTKAAQESAALEALLSKVSEANEQKRQVGQELQDVELEEGELDRGSLDGAMMAESLAKSQTLFQ